MVLGEQIKDIARADEYAARLIGEEIEHRGILACEKEIAAFAKKHGGAVTNDEAEDIIRRFYGLPDRAAAEKGEPKKAERPTAALDIASLLGRD